MQLSCRILYEVSDGDGGGREVAHTGLSGRDDVSILENSRNGVRLDRSWVGVAAEVDVVHHGGVQASSVELFRSEINDEENEEGLTSEMGAGRSSASATTWICKRLVVSVEIERRECE
jgi:hypothetical protein